MDRSSLRRKGRAAKGRILHRGERDSVEWDGTHSRFGELFQSGFEHCRRAVRGCDRDSGKEWIGAGGVCGRPDYSDAGVRFESLHHTPNRSDKQPSGRGDAHHASMGGCDFPTRQTGLRSASDSGSICSETGRQCSGSCDVRHGKCGLLPLHWDRDHSRLHTDFCELLPGDEAGGRECRAPHSGPSVVARL